LKSPASDYAIKIRIDEFFGGHAAVLGNTGSGKSCTVASIIQSLFSKPDTYAAHGASFIILDVNGEYRQSFANLGFDIRRAYWSLPVPGGPEASEGDDKGEKRHNFRLPHWFMSVEEWELLLRASERTQQPVLRTALGLSTLFSGDGNTELIRHEERPNIIATINIFNKGTLHCDIEKRAVNKLWRD
jgi:hypothetical protein